MESGGPSDDDAHLPEEIESASDRRSRTSLYTGPPSARGPQTDGAAEVVEHASLDQRPAALFQALGARPYHGSVSRVVSSQ